MTCAPWDAACRVRSTCTSIIDALSPVHLHWVSAARTTLAMVSPFSPTNLGPADRPGCREVADSNDRLGPGTMAGSSPGAARNLTAFVRSPRVRAEAHRASACTEWGTAHLVG